MPIAARRDDKTLLLGIVKINSELEVLQRKPYLPGQISI